MDSDVEEKLLAQVSVMQLVVMALAAQAPDKAHLLRSLDTLAATIQYRSIASGIVDQAPDAWRTELAGWRASLTALLGPAQTPPAPE